MNLPTVNAILAMSENKVIGKDNKLPWHLPADLKHFKNLTAGHTVIMGRKTYESIGKALPNRQNIILSRDPHYKIPDGVVVSSLKDALARTTPGQEVFIIGGAEILLQSLPTVQHIYLTIIHHDFEGDTFFPTLNPKEWKEVERVRHEADEKNIYDYSFIELERC